VFLTYILIVYLKFQLYILKLHKFRLISYHWSIAKVGKKRYSNSAWVKSVRRKEKTCSGEVGRGRIPAANVDVLLWSVQ